MQRYSNIWWASILLSSIVTGGTSFLLLLLFSDLALGKIVIASLLCVLAGDVVLALMMQAISPTHVKVGPGERRYEADLPADHAVVAADFVSGSGRVTVRGESWHAEQAAVCDARLVTGTRVRVVGRDGLKLVVVTDR